MKKIEKVVLIQTKFINKLNLTKPNLNHWLVAKKFLKKELQSKKIIRALKIGRVYKGQGKQLKPQLETK